MLTRLRAVAAADKTSSSSSSGLPLSRPRDGFPPSIPLKGRCAPFMRGRRKWVTVLLALILGVILLGVGKVVAGKAQTSSGLLPWERHFDEPDYELNTAPFPHQVKCNKEGKLIFMGIFSTAERSQRRDLFRKYILPDFANADIEVKFILARPNLWKLNPADRLAKRAELKRKVKAEIDEFDDIIVLPTLDNIDQGKTFEYFKYMGQHYKDKAPQFIMKVDDDAIWSMPNLVSSFSALDCSQPVYWGSSSGYSEYFLPYYRGMGYAISWPLVAYLGRTTFRHTQRIEDAGVSQLLRQLDPNTDRLQRVDMGHNMADWNQVNTTVNTVCLHWLKDDEWVLYNHHRLTSAWAAANRSYTAGNGVPHADLVETGKTNMPPTECFGWFNNHCVRPTEKAARGTPVQTETDSETVTAADGQGVPPGEAENDESGLLSGVPGSTPEKPGVNAAQVPGDSGQKPLLGVDDVVVPGWDDDAE